MRLARVLTRPTRRYERESAVGEVLAIDRRSKFELSAVLQTVIETPCACTQADAGNIARNESRRLPHGRLHG